MHETAEASAAFAEALRAYEEASRGAPPVDRTFAVGGFTLRLSIAGPALVPAVTAALAHLACDLPRADLTICVWQSGPLTARSLSLLDTSRNLALYCVDEFEPMPGREAAAPFVALLHEWMRDRGRQVLHAGAVGTAAGGVLLVGNGGAGKSTVALSCMGQRLRYAADDYCLVGPGDPPTVYSLYNAGKVHTGEIGWFPHLRCAPSPVRAEEKSVFYLHPEHGEDLIASFPLRAIVMPSLSPGTPTGLRPASPAAVLRALAPSTILQLRAADGRDLAFIAALARRLPGYVLDLGADLAAVEPTIASLLERARA